jgi:hypothetical protein
VGSNLEALERVLRRPVGAGIIEEARQHGEIQPGPAVDLDGEGHGEGSKWTDSARGEA